MINDGNDDLMADDQRPIILYVDEQSDERDNFYTDAYDSGLFSEIIVLHPKQELHEMIEEVMNCEFDALITDFNLTDEAQTKYNGEDLVRSFLEKKKDFPCFIRTSFEEDAIKTSDDVNRVYSKDVKADDHSGAPLFKRISLQIERHHRMLEEWQSELTDLLAIPVEERKAAIVDRIVELDSDIESYLGADAGISKDVKSQLFAQRDDLLKTTRSLIDEMKKKLG